ncbi:uncharacterized protein EI90DRAFT_3120569 [Cantharellus anzutake]|uniref:uncharacterized protein n=1 Tax=Cantharellus anzutake TaxID=1750568 RepID=UPI0019039D6C|nr:uncharacterized protein EI90DRAFT_3120569 [Cantharellus anzutake]KAF8335459.1 hypothetical protein EI90DRAFT_3120569 [Cantharellus anzutake]
MHNGSLLAEAAELSPEIQNEQDMLVVTLEVKLSVREADENYGYEIDLVSGFPSLKSAELAAPGISPVNTCSTNNRSTDAYSTISTSSADGTSSDRLSEDCLSDKEEDMSIVNEDNLYLTGQENPERSFTPISLQNPPDPYAQFSEKSFSLSDILAMLDDTLNKILCFRDLVVKHESKLYAPDLWTDTQSDAETARIYSATGTQMARASTSTEKGKGREVLSPTPPTPCQSKVIDKDSENDNSDELTTQACKLFDRHMDSKTVLNGLASNRLTRHKASKRESMTPKRDKPVKEKHCNASIPFTFKHYRPYE